MAPSDEPEPDRSERPSGQRLSPAEAMVSDVIGRLIEFWGFKRNMGRAWATIYLSPAPLTAQDVRDRLGLSSGAVSMTLTELVRWGAVRRVWVHGDRRDHFVAESQLWKMIARVLSERERAEIVAATEACEEALRLLEADAQAQDPKERERARFQMQRIRTLYELTKLGKVLFDALLSSVKLDLDALRRFRFDSR